MAIWVIEHDGVPSAELFSSTQGQGTPIVIDKNTQIPYYYDTDLGVTPFGSSGWTYLFLASDVTSQSSTPADVTGLTFTPDASSRYAVEGMLMVETDTLNKAPRIGVNWPSGLTRGTARISVPSSTSAETLAFGNSTADVECQPSTFPASTLLQAEIRATFLSGGSPSGNFAVTLSATP